MKKAGYVRRGAIGASVPGFGPITVSAIEMISEDSELAPMNNTVSLWLVLGVLTPVRLLLFPNEEPVRVDMAPGQLILLPANMRYRVDTRVCPSTSRHYWMQIDRTETEPRFGAMLDQRNHYALFDDPEHCVFTLFATMIEAIIRHGPEPFWMMQAHGSGIIRQLCAAVRGHDGIRHISASRNLPSPDPMVDRVLAYLQTHMSERVRLQDLARHLHASPSTVSHRYRAATGEAPIHTLQRMRMLQAKSMLVQGAPLRKIALELGFYDEHHFSRAFKTFEGLSPLEFARQTGANRPMLGPVPGSRHAPSIRSPTKRAV